jgi:hypothetical protein
LGAISPVNIRIERTVMTRAPTMMIPVTTSVLKKFRGSMRAEDG